MDVLDHLMKEHREAEAMLAKLASSRPGPEREATLAQLSDALTLHMEVEERDVYPLVEEVLGDAKAAEAEREHAEARSGLADAADQVDQDGFAAVIEKLTADIGHHVHEEETEIFPTLRAEAGGELDALGDPEDLEAEASEELSTE